MNFSHRMQQYSRNHRTNELLNQSLPRWAFCALLGVMMAVVAALCLVQPAPAREWSEEIQITEGGEYRIGGAHMYKAVDSNGDVNLLYHYYTYPLEDEVVRQPVYQKINLRGETLIDPVIIDLPEEVPDSQRVNVFGIYCDDEDKLHLIMGDTHAYYYAMLNNDGEILIPSTLLEGMYPNLLQSYHAPRLVVDSEGTLIVLAWINVPIGPYEWDTPVVYARYNNEGELLDSVHVLSNDNRFIQDLKLVIEPSDTLHIAWRASHGGFNHWVHYFKVAPEDEIIVDDVVLPGLNNENEGILSSTDLVLDSEERLIFKVSHDHRKYLVRYNHELEVDYATFLSISTGRTWGDIVIDEDQVVHLTFDAVDDRINGGEHSIVYTSVDSSGNIVDSVQYIHDRNDRGDPQEEDYASWGQAKCWVYDGDVGVIWTDNRYDIDSELFIKYSDDGNYVGETTSPFVYSLFTTYPNPFNSTTSISFSLPFRETAALTILDLSGREVARLLDGNQIPGSHRVMWDASGVPSGIYFARLQSGAHLQTQRLVLVR